MACPAVLIENKVLEFILAANISGINPNGSNLFSREKPEARDSDPSPCCIIVVQDEELPKDPKTNSTWALDYPVLVLLTFKGALTIPRASVWRKESRYALRNVLYRGQLLGTDGVVNRCVYNPNPEWSKVGFAADLKISAQMFTYRTDEYRAA